MSRVVLANYSWQYDKSVFIPLPIGMLAAYCLDSDEFKRSYELDLNFQFVRDDPEELARRAADAGVYAASVCIWNEQLSLEVAKRVKRINPDCLVVLGGQSISQWPVVNEKFLRENPQVDVTVRGEGEITFRELLLAHARDPWTWKKKRSSGLAQIDAPASDSIPGISYIASDEFVLGPERKREIDLSVFPSPFLTGIFDEVMKAPFEWQGLWESNRGCVYECTFCSWSALALGSKLGQFPMERLVAELLWFADKKIGHVYCCDANWELLPRDVQLTDALIETKKKHGYPRSFFVNTRKNATAKTFAMSKKLFEAGMSKSLILSMQSMDESTLKNIKRDNIKLSVYHELQQLARTAGVPTCSELILGLPGETLDSFCRGIDYEIGVRQFTLFMYFCAVLPGSEMAKPEYQSQFGIETVRTTILSNHADLAEDERSVPEYEDVVVSTSSLPYEDWLECNRVAWFVYSFVCMGLAVCPLIWAEREHGLKITEFARWALGKMDGSRLLGRERRRLEAYVESIRRGNPTVSRDGIEHTLPIRWPLEEATFLALSENLDAFYEEFSDLLFFYLGYHLNLDVNEEEFDAVFEYQAARIVRPEGPKDKYLHFNWNIPEYFEKILRLEECETRSLEDHGEEIQMLRVKQGNKVFSDFDDFSKKGVWYSRRGGSFLFDADFI